MQTKSIRISNFNLDPSIGIELKSSLWIILFAFDYWETSEKSYY